MTFPRKRRTAVCKPVMGNARTAYAIPNGVTTIKEESFAECAKLGRVTIPKSVKSIGFFAFGVNRTLTDVYYEGSEAEWINIEINGHNDNLIKANIHYNSAGPCVNHKAGTAVKEKVKNATCKAEGSYDSVVYCSVCNSEISRTTKVIPKSAHKYDAGKVTKRATCTAKGVKTYTCTVCGVTKTADITALGHALVHHNAKSPTTHEKGWSAYDTCSRCSYTTYKEIPAKGPTLVKENGVWYYTVNGKKTNATTLCKYGNTWIYVKNGVKSTANTLVNYNGVWYHVNNGTLANDTTLVKYGNTWIYVKNGKKCTDNTLVKYNGVWYHVNKGTLANDTTLVKYGNTWY